MKLTCLSVLLLSFSFVGSTLADDSSHPSFEALNVTQATPVVLPCVGSNVTKARSNIRGRIKNGLFATEGQFPFTTWLFMNNGKGSGAVCTGTIVSSHLVITAAHCIGEFAVIDSWYGSLDNNNQPYRRKGVAFAKHPLYQAPESKNLEHDIAVIYMNKAAKVKSAKLPTQPTSADYFNGISLEMAGWETVETGEGSRYLKYTTVIGESLSAIGHDGNANFICGKGFNDSQLDSGDSGSPLLLGDTLVGVNSFGNSGYSGFTRVDQYLDWIFNADMKCIWIKSNVKSYWLIRNESNLQVASR